jgi:putative sigma-54 modulation protein
LEVTATFSCGGVCEDVCVPIAVLVGGAGVAEEFPVNIIVTGRHLEITAAIRAHAEEKAGKLTKYYDLIKEIEIILDGHEAKQKRAEVVVNAEHRNMFVAHHEGEDLYGCIDQATHKIQQQLTAHKEKFRNRKHPNNA